MAIASLVLGVLSLPTFGCLYRARASANEAATLGDVRTVIAAEAAYAAETGGSYGPLKCLRTPTLCLPGYSGPDFIDAELAYETEKYGYRRTFHPGPEVPVTDIPPGGPFAAERLVGYAFTAVPIDHDRAGTRSFCGDASGRICTASSGEIDAASGACPPAPECADL